MGREWDRIVNYEVYVMRYTIKDSRMNVTARAGLSYTDAFRLARSMNQKGQTPGRYVVVPESGSGSGSSPQTMGDAVLAAGPL